MPPVSLSSLAPRPSPLAPLPTGGRLWRLGPESAEFVLREQAGPTAAVQVVLTEHVAAVLDGRRWLHQTTWWLHHERPTALTFKLPPGVLLLGASVDGKERRLARSDKEEIATAVVALGRSGARCVSLRWSYPPEKEPLAHPSVEGPRLEGQGGSVLWTLHAPPGYRTVPGSFRSGTLAAARLEERRAEAQLRLSKLLLESAAGRLARKADGRLEEQLAACQNRFARHVHAAERLRPWRVPGSTGGGDKELTARLEKQRQENRSLTDAHGLAALRRQAQQEAAKGGGETDRGATVWNVEGLVEEGRPFYRIQDEKAAAGTAPTLVTVAALDNRRALAATGLLLGLLLAVWVLASFPAFVSLTHLFWPEQVVLLGLFGYQTFGPTWPVVFLLTLGIVARVLSLGAGLLRFLQRAPRTSEPRHA